MAMNEDLHESLHRLRSTVESGTTRSLDWREEQLEGVIRFLDDHKDDLTAAMKIDLGRSDMEAWAADIGATRSEAEFVRKRFRKWAAPRKVHVSLVAQPATGRIVPEPLGVALIISPWNYPVNLLLEPMIAAFAAGNAVIAKPSEISAATSGLIARHLPEYLDRNAFSIFEGGADVSTALLAERFDHIFFTGSTKVGRLVLEAAAKHLTPVTLELGGKSPVIVADDADIDVTASRIAWGKTFNAGQTCIAPDYVLIAERNRDQLVDRIARAWKDFFGDDPATSPDYGRIVSDHHHRRLVDLLDGQNVAVGGTAKPDSRYLAPTIVLEPGIDAPIMQEEIFGPILPIVTVDDLDSAIRFVNERPKPLALYVFSGTDSTQDRVLRETSSGGACVNHTLFHFAPHELPFGGVGPSGMGRYHGQSGFDTFSNLKGVLRKPIRGETSLIYPPYGELKTKLLRRLAS